MNLEQKNLLVEQYINNLSTELNKKYPNILDNNKINKAINMFKNSSDEYEVIIDKITELEKQLVENYLEMIMKQNEMLYQNKEIQPKPNNIESYVDDIISKTKDELNQKYNLSYSDEQIKHLKEYLITSGKSQEEIKIHIDKIKENSRNEYEKKLIQNKVKSGEMSSNIEEIKSSVITIFSDKDLSSKLFIYGGTIPYLLTGEIPKRIIGDIDTHVSIDDIDEVRKIIQSNPDKYKIISDSLEFTGEEYGFEMIVNGVNVSVFPTIKDDRGMIIKNFQEHLSTDEITLKSTLFYGIHENEINEKHMVDGIIVGMESPEFTYYTKQAANRDKDIEDNKVLEKIVDHKKIEKLKSTIDKPTELLEEKTIKKKDVINNNKTENNSKEKKYFDKRSTKEVEIAKQIREKNKIITQQKQQQKQQQNNKTKKLVKPNTNNKSANGGFANTLILSLIIGFLIYAVFIITNIIIK